MYLLSGSTENKNIEGQNYENQNYEIPKLK